MLTRLSIFVNNNYDYPAQSVLTYAYPPWYTLGHGKDKKKEKSPCSRARSLGGLKGRQESGSQPDARTAPGARPEGRPRTVEKVAP